MKPLSTVPTDVAFVATALQPSIGVHCSSLRSERIWQDTAKIDAFYSRCMLVVSCGSAVSRALQSRRSRMWRQAVRRRKLGSGSLEVTEACMGTMTMGRQNGKEDSLKILSRYVELGGNFIDAAEMYPVPCTAELSGDTELIVGDWLESRGAAARDKVVIATKVVGPMDATFTMDSRQKVLGRPIAGDKPRLAPDQIREALEASLKRLKTDYVDLYQLHWPDRYTPLWGCARYKKEKEGQHQQQTREDNDAPASYEEVASCMQELIDQGLIREWGLSNETTFGVCSWMEACRKVGAKTPVSIQNDFSLLDRRFEAELAEACSSRHHNIGLLSYGTLAGGALSGKYLDSDPPVGSRHEMFPDFQSRYYAGKSADACRQYKDIAERNGMTLTQLSLAWAYSRWYMGSVILGATSLEQLDENMAAADCREKLSDEVMDEIDRVHLNAQNPNVTDWA